MSQGVQNKSHLRGTTMRRIRFILPLFIAFCINAEAQNKVGMIIGITGTARLKDVNGKKEQKLTSRNFAVPLIVGQSLKSNGNGNVQIKLCNGKTETVGKRWYRVPQVICSSSNNSEKQKVLERIFDYGGRYKINRGNDEFILFPLERETTIIRPEAVVFRWKAISEKKLLLSVNIDDEDKAIWKQEVNGEPGHFTSAELKKLLEDVRRKRPNAKFQLNLKIARLGTENSADFQIFSLQDEANLQKELNQMSNEMGVLRHLAFAEIYSRHKLFNEAANEFEEALKLSPESIELLNATALAQDQAGNLKRRDEIDKEIKILEGTM
jgi:hypothetical protein